MQRNCNNASGNKSENERCERTEIKKKKKRKKRKERKGSIESEKKEKRSLRGKNEKPKDRSIFQGPIHIGIHVDGVNDVSRVHVCTR